jgi:predicted DNA-binding transcriptional regulator AlpA
MTINNRSEAAELPEFYTALIDQVRNASAINTIKIKPAALKVSKSVASLWAAVKLGIFPPPIKISERSIAFVEAELDALLAARREMSRTNQAIDLRVFISLLIAPRQTSKQNAVKPSRPDGRSE